MGRGACQNFNEMMIPSHKVTYTDIAHEIDRREKDIVSS